MGHLILPMRTVLCALCLLGAARAETNPAPARSGATRAALGAELRQAFKYDPSPKTAASDDDARLLILPRYEVFDSRLELGLKADRTLQRKQEQLAAETFTWKEGGTILERRRVKVMFKYDPENNTINLLKLAW